MTAIWQDSYWTWYCPFPKYNNTTEIFVNADANSNVDTSNNVDVSADIGGSVKTLLYFYKTVENGILYYCTLKR